MRGIIPRSVEEIFAYITTTASRRTRFLVRASYLQIYNEQIQDLLKPPAKTANGSTSINGGLAIREDKKRGVFVEGLSEWVVRAPSEVVGGASALVTFHSCFCFTLRTQTSRDQYAPSHTTSMIIILIISRLTRNFTHYSISSLNGGRHFAPRRRQR
jgi:hypothetical protein